MISKQRERWSDTEHELFLEALREHGRAWRKIEGACPFRTRQGVMATAFPTLPFSLARLLDSHHGSASRRVKEHPAYQLRWS